MKVVVAIIIVCSLFKLGTLSCCLSKCTFLLIYVADVKSFRKSDFVVQQ